MRLTIDLRPGQLEDRATGTMTIGGENGERTIRLLEARPGVVVAALRGLAEMGQELLSADERELLATINRTEDEHEYELSDAVQDDPPAP
jgi:hypothetical protein